MLLTLPTNVQSERVYLGECGKQLQDLASYDIPQLRKRIAALQASVPELRRRSKECTNSAKQLLANFTKTCREYGLDGGDVEAELTALALGLPALFLESGLALGAPLVADAAAYYAGVTAFAHGGGGELSTLQQAAAHGVEADDPSAAAAPEAEAEIDWGDGGDIDWGFETVEDGGDSAGAGGDADEPARDVPVPLYDSTARAALVDDVLELRAFLVQRQRDLNSGASASAAPAAVAQVDAAPAGKMLAAVEAVADQLNGPETLRLVMLGSSDAYKARMVLAIQSKRFASDQMTKRAAALLHESAEAERSAQTETPKLAEAVQRARFLKNEIEAALAARMNGRQVHIVGDINTLIR